MGLQYTTNYHVAYMDAATPLSQLDVMTKSVADNLDAAMGRAGYVPPDATTFAALNARVNTAEAALATAQTAITRLQSRATVTGPSVLAVTGTVTPLPFTAKTSRSLASMWSAANADRLFAPVAGEYDLSVSCAWATQNAGSRAFGYVINSTSLTSPTYFHTWVPGAGTGEQTAVLRGIELTAGQYVRLVVIQNAGVSVATGPLRATLSLAIP